MQVGKWNRLAVLVICLPVAALAQEAPVKEAAKEARKPNVQQSLSGKSIEHLLTILEGRQSESKQLLLKATEVTVGIGKLAASGKLPQDQEATKLMKTMVETLEEIHGRLKEIDEEELIVMTCGAGGFTTKAAGSARLARTTPWAFAYSAVTSSIVAHQSLNSFARARQRSWDSLLFCQASLNRTKVPLGSTP